MSGRCRRVERRHEAARRVYLRVGVGSFASCTRYTTEYKSGGLVWMPMDGPKAKEQYLQYRVAEFSRASLHSIFCSCLRYKG